jgi:hypothetical protein
LLTALSTTKNTDINKQCSPISDNYFSSYTVTQYYKHLAYAKPQDKSVGRIMTAGREPPGTSHTDTIMDVEAVVFHLPEETKENRKRQFGTANAPP